MGRWMRRCSSICPSTTWGWGHAVSGGRILHPKPGSLDTQPTWMQPAKMLPVSFL